MSTDDTDDIEKVIASKLKVRRPSGDLVNAVSTRPVNGFKPNFIQIVSIVGPQTDWVLKVMRSKVKVVDVIFENAILIWVCYWWL